MPALRNKFHGSYPGAVYIGRGSKFGNPWSHNAGSSSSRFNTLPAKTRDEAIARYRTWLTTDIEVKGWRKPTKPEVEALRGQDLLCFCHPLPCHGSVLLEIANA